MNCLASNDRRYRPVRRVNGHSLADELLRIPAANRVGVDEAVLVDVRNDEANLVSVAGAHDSQRRFCIANGDHVAVQVGADLVGKIGSVLPDDFLDRLLVAARAGRFQNVLEKLLGGWFHNWFMPVVLGSMVTACGTGLSAE